MTGINDIKFQAEQFLGYFSRLKDGELDKVFRFWAESKDFDDRTTKAIRQEVDRMLGAKSRDGKPDVR